MHQIQNSKQLPNQSIATIPFSFRVQLKTLKVEGIVHYPKKKEEAKESCTFGTSTKSLGNFVLIQIPSCT